MRKTWFVGLVFSAGSVVGCGGDVATNASTTKVGRDAATNGPGGSGGGDSTNASGGASGGDAAANASGGSSGGAGPVPTSHRPADVACPQQRGAGHVDVVNACTQDAYCTAGMNGRCISPNFPGPAGGSGCSYDACFSDSDCPNNVPCKCRKQATDNAPNYCASESNCRIDSDCGSNGFCSPSVLDITGAVAGSVGFGYFCHTPQDACLNDSDCDPSDCLSSPGCEKMACAYTESSHWDCVEVYYH
jgi:hypothetical protein